MQHRSNNNQQATEISKKYKKCKKQANNDKRKSKQASNLKYTKTRYQQAQSINQATKEMRNKSDKTNNKASNISHAKKTIQQEQTQNTPTT